MAKIKSSADSADLGDRSVLAESEVHSWLKRLQAGEEEALNELVPLLYAELRNLARSRRRGLRAGETLSTTALVNEAYLKLLGQKNIRAVDRAEFLALAGKTMRSILVDHARARLRLKRGGDQTVLSIGDLQEKVEDLRLGDQRELEELLTLDDALVRLHTMSPEAALIVQHRYFAGLTLRECADVLQVSLKTVQRRWTTARAWLRKEIDASSPMPESPLAGTDREPDRRS